MKRKLVFFVLCFLTGGGFYIFNGINKLIWFSVLIAATLFFLRGSRQGKITLVMAFIFFCWGVLVFVINGSTGDHFNKYEGRWVSMTGTVGAVLEGCGLR